MKLNKNIKNLLPIAAFALSLTATSCVSDLDVDPTIDKNTDIALKQIKDRQYYEDCIPSYKDIILVSINYNSKAKKCECKITKYSDLEPNLK